MLLDIFLRLARRQAVELQGGFDVLGEWRPGLVSEHRVEARSAGQHEARLILSLRAADLDEPRQCVRRQVLRVVDDEDRPVIAGGTLEQAHRGLDGILDRDLASPLMAHEFAEEARPRKGAGPGASDADDATVL